MLSYEFALLAFLVSFVLSRLVMMRAASQLSAPQQAALVETFASLSRFTLLPGVFLVAVFLFASQGLEGDGRSLANVFLALLGGAAVGMQLWVFRQVRALDLAPGYLRRFLLSRVLLLAGMTVLLAAVAMS